MQASYDLTGKVFLVTGAASGIGASVCHLLAERGDAAICAGDVDVLGLHHLEESIESTSPSTVIQATELDVSDADQVDAWVREGVARFGRIDGAANVAGVAQAVGVRDRPAMLEETNPSWAATMRVNLDGIMYCARAQVRAMLRQQQFPLPTPSPSTKPTRPYSIVNVASIASFTHRIDTFAYCTSKAGCAYLSTALANDVADFGIRINAVSPGKCLA
jgi:chanoclavine-I dehydrogenase